MDILKNVFGTLLNPAVWLPVWAVLGGSKLIFPLLNQWVGDVTGFDWLLS
jgi:hypothetical protein